MIQKHKRKWDSKLRTHVIKFFNDGRIFLPAEMEGRIKIDGTLNIEIKLNDQFNHCLICLDVLGMLYLNVPFEMFHYSDERHHKRVIQLSTAVRKLTKSPYIVKDYLKIERDEWNLIIIHLESFNNYFDKQIRYLAR